MNRKKRSRFWPEGVPHSISYPNLPLFGLLKETAEKHPDNLAIIFGDKRITYEELNAVSDRLAVALMKIGVKKGDRVALLLPNIPQFIVSYFGVLKAGAVITAISPQFKERELQYQLNNSEAETIITLDSLYPTVKGVKEKTRLKRVILIGFEEPDVYSFQELINKSSRKPPKLEINPKEDLAALQYTGGTTGLPKGAMLTHFNLLSNAVAFATWLQLREGKERFLTALPMFHIYGMTTSMNAAVYAAGTIVLVPRFDPKEILETIEKHQITVFCGVPTMYIVVINHPEVARHNLSSIRFCVSGGSTLPPDVQRRFMDLTGGVLIEGYGLSEASPVTHVNPPDPTMRTVKIGSIGLALPDTEAKIMDPETDATTLPPGELGELVVRGPQVMDGYWRMPEETANTLKGGWLHTGDLAKMDEDGYVYIVDRKKDLIKYKGYSVYPREVEDVLYEHPAVKICAVVGNPDPIAGEVPKAFIVLKDGANATEEEIVGFIKEKVAPYKRVREVECRESLPMTSVGKVLRKKLREEEQEKTK